MDGLDLGRRSNTRALGVGGVGMDMFGGARGGKGSGKGKGRLRGSGVCVYVWLLVWSRVLSTSSAAHSTFQHQSSGSLPRLMSSNSNSAS
jgi:hypothetical protein